MTEPIFDHERLDVYRLSIDYVAFSYDLAKTLAVRIDKLGINGWVLPSRFR